ncbi:His-Xaa-Ser system radical SAM maturase HxsB [Celerinatantimonas diazotrophica]|uniref:His-Xaa-Ser system radical SAM maturase HxsB n=1 Tax=Celerinatantimonas diazotrophica TaxID=412034 RepID=A0A4R1K1Y7_9GAMM|nr:His-Xaa-Ser system radical SAM maturase HxsB [Celerinatantimonas diazotrophica]TCK57827.1 His-Xaa-Ser system radical SAM maturase HxsB [Celerinatantimonas diazotrophica]CAG9298109.1 hypothetical protein CEDIAZO_03304 [Celerinatantimonas diazotrophica]
MDIAAPEDFMPHRYQLLPFRFERVDSNQCLLINEVGEYCYLNTQELEMLVDGTLATDSPAFEKLQSKSFVYTDHNNYVLRTFCAQYRARKSFLFEGPALHIFVLTLRCENSCEYCQVTRRSPNAGQYDMPEETAKQSVYRMFESPAHALTIEFQGGEPLLVFDLLKYIVELSVELNQHHHKILQFVVATSLQNIDDPMLQFFRQHNVHISTSMDGPQWLHEHNRPNHASDSYSQAVNGIKAARKILGHDKIAGMTTITRSSLAMPHAIVNEYVKLGFHSIFLRPLNMYGFAVKKESKVGYSAHEFNSFYEKALDYIIELNQQGYHLEEVNASLALNNILTPKASGFVDMRSPCGDGTGVLVYNYDGQVYPSDESRMLVEMGDDSLALGSVKSTYRELMTAKPLQTILQSGVAEALPGCSHCAYLPYCGSNPVQNYSRYGNMVGHRATNAFCQKQKFLYQDLFKRLEDPACRDIFYTWLPKNQYHPAREVVHA